MALLDQNKRNMTLIMAKLKKGKDGDVKEEMKVEEGDMKDDELLLKGIGADLIEAIKNDNDLGAAEAIKALIEHCMDNPSDDSDYGEMEE